MATDPTEPKNVLIPMKLDAFVFNKPVCDGGENKAKIAPITQPNYSFLRLDKGYLQSDIMNPVDLHRAWPAEHNARFTDLGTSKPFRHRQGVYLHWTLPLVYRSGSTKTAEAQPKSADESTPPKNFNTPTFHDVPTRWLVIRKINDMDTVEPEEARGKVKVQTSWVVESDRRRAIEELDDTVDLQVDVSPFIQTPSENFDKISLESQAEVFIGEKISGGKWRERGDTVNRVNLKLTNSSNQLFADYQPHCSNVFSMLDNFEYERDEDGNASYLTQADVSYYVIGWHWRNETDLFVSYLNEGKYTREQTLSSLNMEIKAPKDAAVPENIRAWLDKKDPTRSVCHAALYGVRWNSAEAPKTVPADRYAEVINGTLPISVGTTPLDALTTYAAAHESIDCGTPQKLEKIIRQLEKHLLARDDGVETQFEAADMLYNWNYLRLEGGTRYYVSGGDGTHSGASLPAKTLNALTDINREQALLDGIMRRIKQLRWMIFSEWWKYCISPNADDKNAKKLVSDKVNKIAGSIQRLEKRSTKVSAIISALRDDNPTILPGTRPTYYQQRDPTLLVGAVKSGWEPDYLEKLKIRLDSQAINDIPQSLSFQEDEWKEVRRVTQLLPKEINRSVKYLLTEFYNLESRRDDSNDNITKQTPLFHDKLKMNDDEDGRCPPKPNPPEKTFEDNTNAQWRDMWNDTQPWFPLFLEWEMKHVDIPYDRWTLKEHKSSHESATTIHYVLNNDIKDLSVTEEESKPQRDDRILSGRVLILPQPSFSLEAKIKQLFDDTPSPLLKDLINEKDREEIETNLRKLGFISAPLAGFTSHMLTLEQGNHVKPNLKIPDTGDLIPIEDACRPDAGLGRDNLKLIDIESDVTPYGASQKPPEDKSITFFKPVTHGQFKFTKLNIIDKFGQAIHVIDPRPSETPQKVWPCISNWFKPHDVPGRDGVPNVIDHEDKVTKDNEYVQVPPYINQPSRLNASFIMDNPQPKISSADTLPAYWRPTNEWDNPLWGWVVVNYANFGLQIFLPDGAFYREVRLGEVGSVTSPEWLPFAKPDNPKLGESPEMIQLGNLVSKLANPEYLQEFFDMINEATLRLASPPSAYAEFTNSLIGRPLALVNMGWSLELSTNQLESQLVDDNPQKLWLLPDLPPEEKTPRETYKFPIKLGDRERGFDGLVGYFNSKKPEERSTGDAFDLDKIYSHHLPCEKSSSGGPRTFKYLNRISKENYPILESFYIDPDLPDVDSLSYEEAYNKQISNHAFAALIDPFSPIHAYSGILPVREMILPNWTWQTAMEKMKAFFHAGPLLVVNDVPDYNPKNELKDQAPVKKVEKGADDMGVQLPGVSSEQWVWLQPYMQYPPLPPVPPIIQPDPTRPLAVELFADPVAKEKYMSLSVDTMDQNARLEDGPYTAIEGYLQLAEAPNTQKKPQE